MSLSAPKPPKPVPGPNTPTSASFISRGRGFGRLNQPFRRKGSPVIGSRTGAGSGKPSLIGGA